MKQRINLYTEEFTPRLDMWSLSSVAVIWSVTAVLLAMVWAGVSWYGASLQDNLMAKQRQQQQLLSTVSALQQALEQRKPDAGLERQLAQRRHELNNRQLLVNELSLREQIKQQGFADLLDNLAAKNSRDIWLETIQVSEHMMLLEGQLSKPEAMPQWLQRLGQTSSFSGRTFDSARLFRDEEQLRFELSMSRSPETDVQAQGGQK